MPELPEVEALAHHLREHALYRPVARVDVASMSAIKTFDPPASFTAPLRWARDGHAIAYIDTQNGVSNIIMQALEAGAAKPLTNFTSDRIFWFDLSRDGKWIALSRGMQTSDILLIKDFK